MVNFTESPNPLFDTVFRLSKRLTVSKLAVEKLEECNDDLRIVAEFFSCSMQQAAVLAVLLKINVQSEAPTVRQLLQYFSLKPSFAASMHQVLDVFVKRNWIKPQKDIRLSPLCAYQLSNRLEIAFNSMDSEKLKEKPVVNSVDLVVKMQSIINDRVSGIISFVEYTDRLDQLISQNSDIPLASLIISKNLPAAYNACFSFFLVKHIKGDDEIELMELIHELNPTRELQYRLRSEFRLKQGPLIDSCLIQRTAQDNFIGIAQFCISDKVRILFDPPGENSNGTLAAFSSGLMRVRESKTIRACKMCYNSSEEEHVSNLHRLLQAEQFERFQQNMKDQGMSAGLTALLYGASGTGKTETVLQLSYTSGRSILQVDASSIRSKWVGETEKHLSKVFRDYQSIHESTGLAPILLFNEADAILTRRGIVKERGDHYENAIQNLLLQLLEDFEGIFIGTTNLSENLDPAFQRRILFKVQFEKPGIAVRNEIMGIAFPMLSDIERYELASIYDMTGSEIMNVKKKLAMERVLQSGKTLLELIHGLCRQELSMQKDSIRKSIGFRRA